MIADGARPHGGQVDVEDADVRDAKDALAIKLVGQVVPERRVDAFGRGDVDAGLGADGLGDLIDGEGWRTR